MTHQERQFEFSDFNFGFCPTLARIQRLYIVERSEDAWHIESIVTLVKAINGGTQILSQNLDINQWIVGGGQAFGAYPCLKNVL